MRSWHKIWVTAIFISCLFGAWFEGSDSAHKDWLSIDQYVLQPYNIIWLTHGAKTPLSLGTNSCQQLWKRNYNKEQLKISKPPPKRNVFQLLKGTTVPYRALPRASSSNFTVRRSSSASRASYTQLVQRPSLFLALNLGTNTSRNHSPTAILPPQKGET